MARIRTAITGIRVMVMTPSAASIAIGPMLWRAADRRAGRLHRADRDQMAAPVRRAGFAGLEDAPPGRAADGADRDGDQRDPVGDRDPAAGCFAGSRADALVEPGGWQSGCAAPAGSRSAMTRSPACGGGSASSPIGPRGSSSLPIRSWRPRSPTWSACTSTGERGGDLRRGDWGCRLDLIRAPGHDGQRRRGAARAPRLAARAARTRHPGLALPPPVGHDLYVSLIRTTHRLTVVYESDLPACLHRLTLIRLIHP